ncbi:unnamed protein product [Mycena citricolor]|uniref:ATP-dependent DNA helicase PIF1 n=1 Tax=Mycena citricolor TaxID=2018698 RepID=A0AAD2HQZ9_9AGAR|nr:unnamed protein product [Mycena citricolor]
MPKYVERTPTRLPRGEEEQNPVPVCMPAPIPLPQTSPMLSDEQRHVLEAVCRGESVFFTGPAGTGKSVLLREIIKTLEPCNPSTIAVTASTGVAGLNIGGCTLHSFAGIGLGKASKQSLAQRIAKSLMKRQRWRNTRTLVIDEISMIDGVLFDKLEYIAREVRECQRPFGGIQLVISGDFYQLPPVPDQSHRRHSPSTYAFDAISWAGCVGTPVVLSQVFRQKDDVFVDILASIRVGALSDDHIQKLSALSRPLIYDDGIEPSELFPLRCDVERCNQERLAALPGETVTYRAIDGAGFDVLDKRIDRESAQRLLDRLVALPSIGLKVGAQVMLVQNVVPGSLVNGSVGIVEDFITTKQAVERGIAVMVPKDEPARPTNLQAMNDVVFAKNQPWPLVCFTQECRMLCAPLYFSIEGVRGNCEAHRTQVPLILAWALSIHKSQGQTLQRVRVDLDRVFEKGQAYVALSRATSMEHLEIANLQPSKSVLAAGTKCTERLIVNRRIQAHPRVMEWESTWMSYDEEPEPEPAHARSDDLYAQFDDFDEDYSGNLIGL